MSRILFRMHVTNSNFADTDDDVDFVSYVILFFRVLFRGGWSSVLSFLYIFPFTFQLNSLEVLLSAVCFWTSRGHWYRPSSPRYVPSFFLSRIGFSTPTARRFSLNVATRAFR